MYHPTPLNGSSLPDRTLCLSYDDGPGSIESTDDPGPNTLELFSRSHAEGGSLNARANPLRDWELFTFENHSF